MAAGSQLQTCPYCGILKPLNEFTKEHVLPRALDGNIQPTNPFLIRVCQDCNSACGRWIDGRFIRSWLVHNWRAQSVRRTYDPSTTVLPLTWFGTIEGWHGADETIADFWLGPAGDHVYHFHRPYPDDDALVFAGRPPQIRRDLPDLGDVYVQVRSGSQEWTQVLIRSIGDTFGKETAWHFLNAAPQRATAPYPPVRSDENARIDWIRQRPTDEHLKIKCAIDIQWGVRFLIKFGLGMGVALLDSSFASSPQAARLREALWMRDPAQLRSLGLRGRPFIDNDGNLTRMLGWSDCHTIALVPISRSTLVVVLTLYGKHQASLVVSDEPGHWQSKIDRGGVIWVVAPGFGRCEGPMPLQTYVEAISGTASPNPLAPLEAVLASGTPLPAL